MSKEFNYLTPKMYKKLEILVETWRNNGMFPVKYGTSDVKFLTATIYGACNIFSKYELIYLEEIGFIKFVQIDGITKNIDEQWAVTVEPTYCGINYFRIALTNLLLELKWLIPLIISIIGFAI